MPIQVFDDPIALARGAADRIGAWIRAEGHRTLGLAGGSTPRLTYEFLRSEDVPWERTHVWLTDERHVPIEHPDSNGGMALGALLSHINAPFHPVEFHPDPEVGASDYEQALHQMWRDAESEEGAGLILLGLGDDGHTASLFPGTSALGETVRDYVANWVEGKDSWRLTATPALLARADRLMFLVAGKAKAKVVKEILEQGADLPAAIVNRAAADPVWLLDRAAATQLG